MHVRNIARMVWPVVTGGGGCSLGADVSMWFSNPRHNRDLCSGGGGDNTNTTTTPTQGTIQDFRDRLSIFCGSYHASITSIITPSHHASITNSPTHHSLYFPSSIETRIRIDPDPTNMKIAGSLISYPPDKSLWPTCQFWKVARPAYVKVWQNISAKKRNWILCFFMNLLLK